MAYLYFILPPIVVVASLALVIFLISRKSLEVEKLILKNNKKKDNDSKLVVSAKAKGLHLLERISHLSKIFSLKFHNWNENKLKMLKRKKTEVNVVKEKLAQKEGIKRIIPVARKIDIQFNKKEQENVQTGEKFRGIRKNSAKRAMISRKAVHPDDTRKELEEALIERIAADPRDIEAYERLGDYYISQNNSVDALECYKQVLKLNPQSLTVKGKIDRLNNTIPS